MDEPLPIPQWLAEAIHVARSPTVCQYFNAQKTGDGCKHGLRCKNRNVCHDARVLKLPCASAYTDSDGRRRIAVRAPVYEAITDYFTRLNREPPLRAPGSLMLVGRDSVESYRLCGEEKDLPDVKACQLADTVGYVVGIDGLCQTRITTRARPRRIMTVTSVPDAVRILTRRSIEPTTSYNDNAVVGTSIHGFAIPDTIDDLDSGALHYIWCHAINTLDTPMVGTSFSHPCNLAVHS